MQTLKNFTRLPFLHSQSTSLFSTSKGKICITTPIFYVNSEPHIGHLYSMIYTDAIAKWKRIDGYNVIFSTGEIFFWLLLLISKELMNMDKRFKTQLRPKMFQKSSIVIFMRIDLRIWPLALMSIMMSLSELLKVKEFSILTFSEHISNRKTQKGCSEYLGYLIQWWIYHKRQNFP